METRFKKLLNRRSRMPVEPSWETGFRNDNQHPSRIGRPSILYQSRTKSTQEAFKLPSTHTHAPFIRSFSYDSVSAGKAPIVGALPQKGNGPVKLQTSRRLSSGELMATTQDPETMLQDLREGDYIVGRKERPMSRTPVATPASPTITRKSIQPSANQFSNLRIPTSPTWASTPRSTNPSVLHETEEEVSHTTAPNIGLGLDSPALIQPQEQPWFYPGTPSSEQNSFRPVSTALGPQPHSRIRESATLEALRRADHTRLVGIYDDENFLQQLTQGGDPKRLMLSPPLSPLQQFPFPFTLEPPHSPYVEDVESKQRRGSDVSGLDSSCDGTSGQSSLHRASGVSFHDDSSTATAQTSLAEDDAGNAGDDIRKLVAQMRSNYLTALDARPLPPPLSKSQKRRRKIKSASSPIIGSSEPLPSKRSPTVSQGFGRQTWHPQNHHYVGNPNKRMHSAPFVSAHRLSPIRAASPQEDDENSGIRRADSTTLGGLMAELTRSNVQSETALYAQNADSDVCLSTGDLISQVDDSKRTKPEISTNDIIASEYQGGWLAEESDSMERTFLDSPDESPELQSEGSRIDPTDRSSGIHRFPSLALSKAERPAESRYHSNQAQGRSGLSSPTTVPYDKYSELSQRSSHLGNTSTPNNKYNGQQHRRHQSCTPAIGGFDYNRPDGHLSHAHSSSTISANVPLVGITKPPGNFF